MPTQQDQQQAHAQIVPARSQVLRLEPVVAAIHGGGTSAVVIRGGHTPTNGGVRVRIEDDSTSARAF